MIGLYKTELVRRKGPWRNLDDLEFATLEWVDWFNNRRLFSALGYVPPVEYEANHVLSESKGCYSSPVPAPAGTQQTESPRNPGRFTGYRGPSSVRNHAIANYKSFTTGESPYLVRFSSSLHTRYINDTLGQVIRKARWSTGLGQVELAELVGVNPTSVRRWESYAETPEHRHPGFLRACEGLGIDPDRMTT